MEYLGIDWSYRRAAWCSLSNAGVIVGEGAVPAEAPPALAEPSPVEAPPADAPEAEAPPADPSAGDVEQA